MRRAQPPTLRRKICNRGWQSPTRCREGKLLSGVSGCCLVGPFFSSFFLCVCVVLRDPKIVGVPFGFPATPPKSGYPQNKTHPCGTKHVWQIIRIFLLNFQLASFLPREYPSGVDCKLYSIAWVGGWVCVCVCLFEGAVFGR